MKIYMAGPLFTLAERLFNAELARGLRAAGHEVWLPQEHDKMGTPGEFPNPPAMLREQQSCSAPHATDDKLEVFRSCIEGIHWCEVVVACMDGPDPDSGTCVECGYAYCERPIVAYRTDFRAGGDGDSAAYNLVLARMATTRLDLSSSHTSADPVGSVVSSLCSALDALEGNEPCLSGSHTSLTR